MMQMKSMRKRRNRALFFIQCLSGGVAGRRAYGKAARFGALSILLLLLVRQTVCLGAVLSGTTILAVPSAFISKGNWKERIEDTVVSPSAF